MPTRRVTVRYLGHGYDEPLELDVDTVDADTGETGTVRVGLTADQAATLEHELKVRLLQHRNTPPPTLRRLPYAE